ncbi:MAG TPA: DUF1365 domain-containing protein [Kofleriaceae bacterium]|nr:DUF1365 domain-containing protein [Kofleriaceae bacterium]
MTAAPRAPLRSALYRGHLVHVRRDEHARRFRYPICVAALELDELERLHARLRLFSYNRKNLFSLHDADYGAGDAAVDLRTRHRALLAAHGLPAPAQTTLVTQLRTADYVFNPVSFFLGHDAAGRLESAVAEVNNNYGGRHAYVLGPRERTADATGGRARFVVDKTFFVSPFIHGPARYAFTFAEAGPGASRLDLHMDVTRPGDDRPFFVAHLGGARVPLTDRALLAAAVRYPLMSVQVIALIYGEALWNHARRVPFRRPGPDHRPT